MAPNGDSRDQCAVLSTQNLTRAPTLATDNDGAMVPVVVPDDSECKRVEQELKHSVERLRKTLESTVHALSAAAEIRDPYTAGHQHRVSRLAQAFAQTMGLDAERIEATRVAGLLHDLGKIYVPTEILSKPGQLTDLERQMIRMHPGVGHKILSSIDFPWPVAQMVLQHHERKDGSGYPAGLAGDEILLEARIVAVADVMESMSSHRPYRAALCIDLAIQEVRINRGTLCDPDVVDACVRAFAEKLVRLD